MKLCLKRADDVQTLLADIYSWVSLMGGNEKGKDRSVCFAEKAVTCIKNAIKYDPENRKYREDLKGHYHWRNEVYKC